MEWLIRGLGLDGYTATLDRVLVFIIMLVLALFFVAIGFALLVVAIRARHVRQQRRAERLHQQWHDLLLDVLGGETPVTTMHARVGKGEELELLAFLMQFARRLRGDEARVLEQVGAPFLPHALREQRSRSPERRAQAVQALAAFGMTSNTANVLSALDDQSPYVAMTAAQALARPDHDQHAPHVIARLWRFVDWSDDYLGAMLARIGPAATEPARRLLADDTQPYNARAVAADVLRRLNDSHAADIAAQVIDEGAHPEVISGCLRLLAQVGRASHLVSVRKQVGSSNGLVRAKAVLALATLGGDAEVETISAALRDPSQWVVQEAARGLLALGRGDVLRELSTARNSLALVAQQVLQEAAAPAPRPAT